MNPHVNHRGAGFHPIRRHDLGVPDRSNEEIGFSGELLELRTAPDLSVAAVAAPAVEEEAPAEAEVVEGEPAVEGEAAPSPEGETKPEPESGGE